MAVPIFPGAIKLATWLRNRQLQREAEIEIMEDIAWQQAREAAANKILRRAGEKP